jgi:hypothetical protein
MLEPEPELEPELYESRSRSRSGNKKFRLHNTGLQDGRGTASYTACDLKKRAEEQQNSLEVQAVQPNSLFVVFLHTIFSRHFYP